MYMFIVYDMYHYMCLRAQARDMEARVAVGDLREVPNAAFTRRGKQDTRFETDSRQQRPGDFGS